MNASTFTARVITSTGADVAAALSGAVGALSGPLHGGAPSRVLSMLDGVEEKGDAEAWVKEALDRGDRLMGFGHRVYRAEDPRARVLRETARKIGAPRLEAAEALEEAALAELKARKPDRVLATNVEFWSAVVLDFAEVPSNLFTPLFASARVGGWAAHILEQKREGAADPAHCQVHGRGPAAGVGGQRGLAACRPERSRPGRHARQPDRGAVRGRGQGRRRLDVRHPHTAREERRPARASLSRDLRAARRAAGAGPWRDEAVELAPDQVVVVPPDTPHGFRNTGDEPLLVVSVHERGAIEQTWLDREPL